jgi:L-fucose mutarotase
MIKSEIIHPDLLQALAQCGHKANILIADANYSFLTNSSPRARIIYLNFSPGLISSVVILQKMLGYINIEKAVLMSCPDDFDNTIAREYRTLLAESTAVEYVCPGGLLRAGEIVGYPAGCRLSATRRFANILLTVGPTLL